MTRNKAQKAVTRQRMAETGEPYTVARRATLSSDDPSSEEQYAREAREAGVSEAEIAAQLAAFRLRDAAEQARELADAAEEAADVAERRAELARGPGRLVVLRQRARRVLVLGCRCGQRRIVLGQWARWVTVLRCWPGGRRVVLR